ncbi:MAG: AI-2E family transporter [Alphaproteobacteria bacterium]|nr:AI-2E family transporter [Alphaproteobacteria bacterium]
MSLNTHQPISLTNKALFWIFVSGLFFAFLWMFNAVLMPFVLGFAIAYLLNPTICKLGKIKIGRKPATLLILSSFFIMLTLILAVISPLLFREMAEFAEELPNYIDKIWVTAQPLVEKIQTQFGLETNDDIIASLQPYMGRAAETGAGFLKHIISGGGAIFDFTLTLFLTPIVAYFLLNEWPKITEWVYSLMPRDHEGTLKGLLSDIDKKLAGFIRGQLSVCGVLGIIYAVALMVAGLKYGFFIGLMAGVLSIIPLVGSVVGLLVSVMVAWFQTGDIGFVGMIAAIFLVGQVIEGNFLTPKLVGNSVGLHPLWVLFALMAGGAVLGILGMMLAVPVAAIVGVLIGFFLLKYKQSSYYKKHPEKKAAKKTVKKKTNATK